jgi:hypothetical protein
MPFIAASHSSALFGRHEHQQEAAAACAQQLAAKRAGLESRFIALVDFRVGDRGVQRLLVQPGLVQKRAEIIDVAGRVREDTFPSPTMS